MNKFERAFTAHQQGRLAEAEKLYQAIIRGEPGHFRALYNLAHIRMGRMDYQEAVKLLRRANARQHRSADGHNLLGVGLMRLARQAEALTHFQQAIALRPDFPEAHLNLADTLRHLRRSQEALTHYERAVALRRDWAEAEDGLGMALQELDRPEEALSHLDRALTLMPDFGLAHANRGYVLHMLGRLEEARQAIGRALELDPRRPTFYRLLGESVHFQRGDRHLIALLALEPGIEQMPPEDRMELHYALAKAYQDLSDPERAFRHLVSGNALKRQAVGYREQEALELLRQSRQLFTREAVASLEGLGDLSEVPIFIVGMPRSGSTLVEQILASHPDVYGAGELKEFDGALERLGADPDASAEFGGAELRKLGADYVSRLRRRAPSAPRITDKLPSNFRHIGLIHLALPNARMIHTRRNPIATCLSCFMNVMALPYTHDLAELGRYYRAYEELMAHWRVVLPPGAMLEVDYEAIVNDLEGQARRILAFCGLDWNDRCLRFDRTQRLVRTASKVQVRQPLYRDALQRWRLYQPFLRPLLDALELDDQEPTGAAEPR